MGPCAPFSNMKVTFFKSTRIGEWWVKVSLNDADEGFILQAHNQHTNDYMIRSFIDECDLQKFVYFLGEYNE